MSGLELKVFSSMIDGADFVGVDILVFVPVLCYSIVRPGAFPEPRLRSIL